ncbi:MAG: 2-C-methyl-D-erythritol 2,4-cyclodiphosphate synthase [Fibrobacter sp.]|nr:2-C-methyl-D-erythritol 2,4-cyclodiphosphate synthase [Fibrobacter sp.]
MFRTGFGADVHAFVEGRPCILGGVNIPHHLGLAGHSDADAVVHALCDAILGAMGLGDIGTWFPDNDPAFKDVDSLLLLAQVQKLMEENSCVLVNADIVLFAEEPKLKPHRQAIQNKLSEVLKCRPDQISVKASTMEKKGFVGRSEGVFSQVVVSIYGPAQIKAETPK